MRGLQTPVRAIRRQVFTEVAKLGFKANAETLVADMEAIPYEIVGEDSEVKYRESIYRARAVVRERLRLAMGLSLRPENKPVHLTAGVEASNISEKYYEPPLMQVIPSGCESCEENKYEVSNMCKGCLAHPCQEVCPRGAISMVNGKSFIDQDKCIKCGKCISGTSCGSAQAPPPDRWADGTASHCHGNVPGLSSRLPPADSATSSIPLSVRRS